MNVKLLIVAMVTMSALAMTGCQTAPSQVIPQDKNIVIMRADIDSDSDGVLDAIDECPETLPHILVDAKGCEIIVEGGDELEMEFSGFFPPMSSQLPDIYDLEFAKIEEKLNEYPEATVFIFGHVASNEVNEDALESFDVSSLARNRALIVKNMLVLDHDIAAERIRTYDCSNKILNIDTESIDRNYKALDIKNNKSKQSRVTLRASSEVSDLNDLKYVSYSRMYGEYAKHCVPFE